METYELFSLPSDHWTWVATRTLPWPLTGIGYVGCCGRCGELTRSLRQSYATAWEDCDSHHRSVQAGGILSPGTDTPDETDDCYGGEPSYAEDWPLI
jgi:hypothetical protein